MQSDNKIWCIHEYMHLGRINSFLFEAIFYPSGFHFFHFLDLKVEVLLTVLDDDDDVIPTINLLLSLMAYCHVINIVI